MRDRHDAGQHPVALVPTGGLRRPLTRLLVRTKPDDEGGRPEERRTVRGEDDRRVAHGQQEAAERGAEERADALERARRDVRGRQLRRRRDERRQQRCLRRPEDRAGDRREGDEPVDDRRRPVGRNHDGGADHQPEPHDVAHDHRRHTREAVDEARGERRHDRSRDEPDQPDDADCGRAALLVRVDAERDEVGPGAEDRADPRELEPAERRAREHRAERTKRCPHAALGLDDRRIAHVVAHHTRNAGRFHPARASGG